MSFVYDAFVNHYSALFHPLISHSNNSSINTLLCCITVYHHGTTQLMELHNKYTLTQHICLNQVVPYHYTSIISRIGDLLVSRMSPCLKMLLDAAVLWYTSYYCEECQLGWRFYLMQLFSIRYDCDKQVITIISVSFYAYVTKQWTQLCNVSFARDI